ncbi:hypothetical protein EYF80_017948 [Liparis tanakae]|uniref:Uncharacterized protein n=1 Tax=Liparis tanakae TaxID=230148 RepID=A0A4Z2I1D6_9TELE|nr:hypothetical protein EYF80_017948 [Liparis tanakae]
MRPRATVLLLSLEEQSRDLVQLSAQRELKSEAERPRSMWPFMLMMSDQRHRSSLPHIQGKSITFPSDWLEHPKLLQNFDEESHDHQQSDHLQAIKTQHPGRPPPVIALHPRAADRSPVRLYPTERPPLSNGHLGCAAPASPGSGSQEASVVRGKEGYQTLWTNLIIMAVQAMAQSGEVWSKRASGYERDTASTRKPRWHRKLTSRRLEISRPI